MINLFLKMVAVHFLLDFPLQGNFLARAKNHRAGIPNVPWYTCLFAHAALQGAGVWYVTGRLSLGIAETFIHATADFVKVEAEYKGCPSTVAFNIDQLIHILCKLAWCIIALG